jgi:hypothetical protein
MADKFASRITAGVLLALTFGALIPVSVCAQNYNAVDQRFIPGTTYSGYNRPMTPATGGNYWWYGGGAAGYPYGGGYGGGALGGNLTGASSELLYPTADGPMPTTAPVPSYQTEAMDNLATTHQTPHNDGPSMSLTPDQMDMPKVSSYFHGFYRDLQAGAQYGGSSQGDTSGQVAISPPQQQPAFAHPPVQSHLSSMDFTSKAHTISGTAIGVRSDVRPKLQEAEQQFQDMKTSGQLGTFDVQPLETQMADLRRRAREVYNIQSDVEQRAEEGKLINDIETFEFQLKQHADGSGM